MICYFQWGGDKPDMRSSRAKEFSSYFIELTIAQVMSVGSPRVSTVPPPLRGKCILDGYYKSQLCCLNFCGQYETSVICTSFTKTSINTSWILSVAEGECLLSKIF